VAETLGFQTEAAFRRAFKRLRNVGPGSVRREARQ
jgi:AraC-like DNA-binding protein